MPLPSSGTISLLNIADEFGGSTPHAISEYYRGAGLVPNTSANANIPTAGQIAFSNFYGGTAGSPITYVAGSTASSGTQNELNITVPSAGVAGDLALVFAYKRGSNTPPIVPATFSTAYSWTGNNNALTAAYRFITSGDPGASFFFDRTQAAVCILYRNIGPAPLFITAALAASPGSGNIDYNPRFFGTMGTYTQSQRAVVYGLGLKGGMLSSDFQAKRPLITFNGESAKFKAAIWNFQYSSGTGSSAAGYDTTADINGPAINIPNGVSLAATISPSYIEFMEWMTMTLVIRGTY